MNLEFLEWVNSLSYQDIRTAEKIISKRRKQMTKEYFRQQATYDAIQRRIDGEQDGFGKSKKGGSI